MKGNNFYDPRFAPISRRRGSTRSPRLCAQGAAARARADGAGIKTRPGLGRGTPCNCGGSVLYDDDENCFKMWCIIRATTTCYERTGQGHFMCYATSKDGIVWEKPELGIVACEGSRANNIVYPPPGVHYGLDPWGVVKDPQEQDPSKRYKMGMYQQRPTADAPQETPTMDRQARNALRKVLFDKIPRPPRHVRGLFARWHSLAAGRPQLRAPLGRCWRAGVRSHAAALPSYFAPL